MSAINNAAIVLALCLFAYLYISSKPRTSALPPGPKPLPLLGNIRDLPPAGAKEWEHWLKHKDLYGPISSVTVLGTTIVLLHDAKLAFEMMEKRGTIYSDRPNMVFGMEMCGWKHVLASQNYGDRLRALRRQIFSVMGTKGTLAKFYPLQDVEVSRFLLRVVQSPEKLVSHVRTEAGAIILKIAYGYTVEPHKADPLVDLVDRAMAQFSVAALPGTWMVDTIPALRHMPEWVPGAGFKKTAQEWYATLMETAEKPMRFVKHEMQAKRNVPSYVSGIYEKNSGKDISNDEEYTTKWAAASLYTGGGDTTVSAILIFFLAMTIHPEVQQKAREEIDQVIGTHRLPTFEDREKLPYVEAVFREVFRWHPIGPMGLPHVATQDDVVGEYMIPKGAMILPNIWWFTHDPSVYNNPSTFDPDRFLTDSPPPNPTNYIFGFGRRICPGRLLAESSVWLTVAKSLAALDIKKGYDKNIGKDIEPTIDFEAGIISHPLPFEARITPRSPKHEALIRAVEREHPWEESSAKVPESIKLQ